MQPKDEKEVEKLVEQLSWTRFQISSVGKICLLLKSSIPCLELCKF